MLILDLLYTESDDGAIARTGYCTWGDVMWRKSTRVKEIFVDADDAVDGDEF